MDTAGQNCSGIGSQPQIVPPIQFQMPGNAADVMRCLFNNGPTWDGDVPSKTGRDELVDLGFAARGDGYQWLTPKGMTVALANGLHRQKEAREARLRAFRAEADAAQKHIPRSYNFSGSEPLRVITACEFELKEFTTTNKQIGPLLIELRTRYPHAFVQHSIPGWVLVVLDELCPPTTNQA